MRRIGFACKWIDTPEQIDGLKPKDLARKYNTGTTTVSWLNRQSRDVAEGKLWALLEQNTNATKELVKKIGQQTSELRMLRLSSDMLPVYTEKNWKYFYKLSDVRTLAEKQFAEIGKLAREHDVRLSFHPGQFCVLASENDAIVENSIEEFEYHADMARWMGYGQKFQDFKINVHISGKKGPNGIRKIYNRLSNEARNCITIENEELTYDLHAVLEISDICPIVLDIHHHWVNCGEYIQSSDVRIKKIIDSWRGVRPVIHYSVSREDYLTKHSIDELPILSTLMESNHKKQKLRAHSDFYWNTAVNNWALTHWEWADIMCESKAKNLASFKLYEHAKKT